MPTTKETKKFTDLEHRAQVEQHQEAGTYCRKGSDCKGCRNELLRNDVDSRNQI